MISGFFDPAVTDWPVPRVHVWMSIPELAGATTPAWFQVNFLIDTGATTTSLNPVDSLGDASLSISLLTRPDLWPQSSVARGIGGDAAYLQTRALYGFTHSNGSRETIRGQIDIAQLTTTNRQIPSLLGWDILQHFKLTLDWPARTITLE